MWLVAVGVGLVVIAVLPYGFYVGLVSVLGPIDRPTTRADGVTQPVSILVPTYNEAGIVATTMQRLCAIEYPLEQVEVVIVDSSDDETASIVRRWFADREHPKLTVIEEEDRGGVARAVNRGVEAATHDIVFRTDCDAHLDINAVGHAVETLQNPAIGAVTGRQLDVIGESGVEQSYRSMQARNQALETALDSVFMVHGPCFAFRRTLFDPIPTDTVADDTEIAIRIREQGYRVVMDPAMLFAEVGVSDIRERRHRKDRRAEGLLQVLWRHRGVLGRHGWFGWVVMPCNWWFLAISPWLTLGGVVLGFVGLVLLFPPAAVVLSGLFGLFIALGHQDRLHRLEPVYTVFDAHLSLVLAGFRLVRDQPTGVWRQDTNSRALLGDD